MPLVEALTAGGASDCQRFDGISWMRRHSVLSRSYRRARLAAGGAGVYVAAEFR